MNSSGFSRENAEERGFTPSVVATLGVSMLPGVGPVTLRHLGEPSQVLNLLASEDLHSFEYALNAKGARFSSRAAGFNSWKELRERVWREGSALVFEMLKHGVQCITSESALYPAKLNDLGSRRPNWLFLRGNVALLGLRSVAVVGTREPSDSGEFLTKYAVSVCRDFGFPVVSGLAKGIDSTAHEWSLKLRVPNVSILGSGLLVPYPSRNIRLAERIVDEGGLLVSEYLPHQLPAAEMFVWRNRLQASLSEAVIAAEWKRTSGTAHTVRFANEMGRVSISLSLLGGDKSPDSGRATHHYVLPTQHDEFVSLISSCGNMISETAHQDAPIETEKNIDIPPPKFEKTSFLPGDERQASLF